MKNQKIIELQNIFSSRLDTLSHLLDVAEGHFADHLEALLDLRIAPDMLPFSTQIAFVCNQPRNFALWCLGEASNNLDPNVTSLVEARSHISSTKKLLTTINVTDSKLLELKRIDLEEGLYLEISGLCYVNDFLMPNFYFHITTAYNILRMAGAPIGKRDFMIHLVPFVKHQSNT
ncbi:conserved hypothetical protein [Rippkaea orientalis PCC 8801]|uniref:DUF1993 domain-containing protein n=1 Tax=Rippkaea orientalis (strain PCC 8801 / RF-1) TaxID=41431 RepID=B7K461_RIPO1|nr:DUF1993 domain-containing protein [Rippkaea orientalis]ACK67767.1 conserved hypothetical protein [Rippkaea orientalis PCC 8801]